MKMKCLVKGCSNRKGEGVFIGDLCRPCYNMLTTGIIHEHGETFLHDMQRGIRATAEKLQDLVDNRPCTVPHVSFRASAVERRTFMKIPPESLHSERDLPRPHRQLLKEYMRFLRLRGGLHLDTIHARKAFGIWALKELNAIAREIVEEDQAALRGD